MRGIVLLALALVLPAILVAGPTPESNKHVLAALEAKHAGQLDAAVAQLRTVLEAEPDNLQAHWILAWTLHDQGHKPEAIAEFGEVMRIDASGQYGKDAQRIVDKLTAPPPPPPPVHATLDSKLIALTFDDGPDPVSTPRLLDMLRAANVKVTFFVLGQLVQRHPEIVQREIAEGHQVGIHGWDHKILTAFGAGGVQGQINRTRDAIVAACGVEPVVMRPPYGAHNATVRANVGDRPLILWDVDPLDWKFRNSDSVRTRVCREMRSGSIVLMHDIHATTVAAVPSILDVVRERGLTPVTVSELIGDRKPGEVLSRLKN